MTYAIAQAYVRGIRNPAKHAYAVAYLRYLVQGGEEPERPAGLSYMGAQAVRLALQDYNPEQ